MAKNENQAVFVCVLTYLLLGMIGAEDVSISSCAEYVSEGGTLDCECVGYCQANSTVAPTWPGHADTSNRLVVTNISRLQDGRQFVCQMECDDQTSNTTYTLHVAYGPDETEIVGPSAFITFNGTQTLTLTCNATVIPTPDYEWLGEDCENGNTENTCRYTPSTTDDGKSVVCVASNRKFSPWKRVRSDPYYFNLLYPPQVPPEITTNTTSDPILIAGDLLTCTVTGGKPLVSNITFFCDTPHHQDQDDVRNETAVSSSVVIDTSQATEDNMTCNCSAIWATTPDFYTFVEEKTFQIQYPPRVPPEITTSSTSDSILRAGDLLTCTVTGGKPLVSNVTFFCDTPHHQDQDDVRNETAVTSSVVIDTSQATEDNMTCNCSAIWAAKPDSYARTEEKIFQTQYPAIVKTFVLNGSHDSLTVTESEGSNVTIQCDARGRPGPTLLLSRTSHDGTVNLTDVDEGSEGVTDNALDHSITMANWTDMGNYTCIVWNGVGVEDSKAITLNVASKPRPASKDSKGRDRNTPLNMTDKGIQIELRVYPDPDKFTFTHYKGDSNQNGEDVSEKNMFTSHVTNSGPGNNFMMCSIKETHVQAPYLGIYKVNISNDFGSIDYYFAVKGRKDDSDDLVSASSHTAAIVGGVLAAVAFLIILSVTIFLVYRRRKQDQMPVCRQWTPETSENEYTNQAFTPTTDNDSGMGMNGHSSPAEMSAVNLEFNAVPRELGGAGYACVGDFPPPRQKGGESTKKSGRAAAYEVTSIAPTGKVNIKQAAPQPNAYQDPWDIKKGEMTLAGAPGGPPTLHNVGPKGDEYAMVSNPKNKTTITVGPKGDVYSTVVKYDKGDNTQGPPAKAQGQEDAAASGCPPLPMTHHPLDTPGYATLAQMAPDQGKQGDVTGSSGDAAAIVPPVQNTSSSGDGTDTYDHFQRDGHDPKTTSQGPDVQYSHIGSYGKV